LPILDRALPELDFPLTETDRALTILVIGRPISSTKIEPIGSERSQRDRCARFGRADHVHSPIKKMPSGNLRDGHHVYCSETGRGSGLGVQSARALALGDDAELATRLPGWRGRRFL
jgi:hypothetical protein